ncbi:carbohydrate ABC transporter permease [Natronospora cellulosivora (SeqCode)]
MKLKKKLSLKQKKSLMGYVYTAPFIIGFLLFFAYPFYQAIVFSLNELQITQFGYELVFVGLENYDHALLVDPDFVQVLTDSFLRLITHVPAIIIFSFFVANILNQKFRGRFLARLVFFLPVIITSGIIIQMEMQDMMTQEFVENVDFMLGGATLESLLLQLQMPEGFAQYIIDIVDQIPEIIEASAIPILIFLAGLQSIPSRLYEAADIEGATGWEKFWKITCPLLSPLFITNIVFIIVSSFTSVRNPIVNFINDAAWGGAGYGVSVAMSVIYFAVIAITLTISLGIISKKVFYMK